MQYRDDTHSENKLSVLGFGCMRFPRKSGRIDMEKTEQLILRAYENGVNYYDTAYIYGGSEEALGEILEKNHLREKIYIATKLPQSACTTTADFDKFFEIEKKRLRTNYIDYYLMHNITSYSQWESLQKLGIEDWIAKKKASGEIRQVGFSYHGKRNEFLPMLESYPWDFVQIQYNYINTNYQAGTIGLKHAAEKGMSVIIMEPLLGGKLANGLPKEAAALFQKADPQSTPVSWALRWIWNHPEVTLLLSGMNETAQLEENLKLADTAKPGMLSVEEQQTIEDVIKVLRMDHW